MALSPDEERIHKLLKSYSGDILDSLDEIGYFDFETEESIKEIPASFWRGITKASIEKNEEIWPVAFRAFSNPALDQGIARTVDDLATYTQYGQRTLGTAPLSWHNQVVRQYYEERSLQFVKDLSTTDRIKLRGYLFSHFNDNEVAFAKFIKEKSYICDGNFARLKRIARTERHTAVEGGGYKYAVMAGAQFKQWWTAGDNRVREAHRLLHGQIRPINEPFDNGLLVPGEVNCRCHLAYFFDRPGPWQEKMGELRRLQEEFKAGRMELGGEMSLGLDIEKILPPAPPIGTKPGKAKIKAKAEPPPAPKFVPAKDIREARKRLRAVIARGDNDPLWKDPSRMGRDMAGTLRPALRFRQFAEGKLGKIKEWDLELSNIALEKLEEFEKRAANLKIPALRGLSSPQGSYAGQMGDGVLGLSKKIQEGRLAQKVESSIRSYENMLEVYTRDLKRAEEELDRLGGTTPVFSSTSFADNARRTELAAQIEKKRKDVASVSAGLNKLKAGEFDYFTFNPGSQPFVSSELYLHKERVISDLEHEFAHHIHQQTYDTQYGLEEYIGGKHGFPRKSGLEPEIEQAWIRQKRMTPEMYEKHISYKPPTKYADKNSQEWFAENYTLYMMGHKEMVSSEAIPIVERIIAQQGQGPVL